MSVAVFRQALRQVRRTLVILPLAAGTFLYLVLLSSSAFLADPQALPGGGAFFRRPPRAIEAFLGGSADFFQPGGWLAAALTHPIMLAMLAAAALAVSAGAVAAEVERGSVDMVLSRPVGRARFLLAKAAAAAVAVTLVELGGLAGALAAGATVDRMDEIPTADLLAPFVLSWLLFLGLAMVALLVSARSSLRSRAIGMAVGLFLAWYFGNFIALLIDGISGLRYVSPFHYFRPAEILAEGPAAADAVILAGVAAGAALAAVWVFARRDLAR